MATKMTTQFKSLRKVLLQYYKRCTKSYHSLVSIPLSFCSDCMLFEEIYTANNTLIDKFWELCAREVGNSSLNVDGLLCLQWIPSPLFSFVLFILSTRIYQVQAYHGSAAEWQWHANVRDSYYWRFSFRPALFVTRRKVKFCNHNN